MAKWTDIKYYSKGILIDVEYWIGWIKEEIRYRSVGAWIEIRYLAWIGFQYLPAKMIWRNWSR